MSLHFHAAAQPYTACKNFSPQKKKKEHRQRITAM